MTVDRDYLLRKPHRPSAMKVYFDTNVVPLAVNAAGNCEVVLDRLAKRSGLRPRVFVGALVGFATIVGADVVRRWLAKRQVHKSR